MPACTARYEPRDPQDTILYRIVQEHLESFLALVRVDDGPGLPAFVEREFRRFLECGIFAHGFARLRCRDCHDELLVPFSCKCRTVCVSCSARRMAATAAHLRDRVLPAVPVRHCVLTLPEPLRFLIVYRPELIDLSLGVYTRTLFEWTAERSGVDLDPSTACGSVSFIQRFGGSLQLFIHFHTLLLSGAYQKAPDGKLRFHPLPPPTTMDLHDLESRLATRLVRAFERRGLLEQGEIVVPSEELHPRDGLESCQTASLLDRVAFGPRAGLRVRRERDEDLDPRIGWGTRTSRTSGFSLFLGDSIDDPDVVERLARYVARPAVALERLSLTPDGDVRLAFARPHADGTRAVVLSPLEFLERLAALVAPPRKNLVRYHGLWGAPHKPCYVESGIM